MDWELEALDKVRGHVADVTKLAEIAEAQFEEGRFEDASEGLRLMDQHTAIGREGLSGY